MYHAMRLHSPGTAASGRNTWNPGSLEFLILGHCSGKAPETLHLSSVTQIPNIEPSVRLCHRLVCFTGLKLQPL